MYRVPEIERHIIMQTDVICDVYSGKSGEEHTSIIGWESTCECGFSWSNWEEEIYG